MIPIIKKKDIPDFLERFNSRRTAAGSDVTGVVRNILQTVREKGDRALIDYTRQLDGADTGSAGLRVSGDDIVTGADETGTAFRDIIMQAAANIRTFHEKSKPETWISWEADGVLLGQRVTPLKRAGIYVPGGRAAYPSSLIMAAVPAMVAGVAEIAIVSPPDPGGLIHAPVLATAQCLGITEIYRVGGAQAIAALAWGTETIPAVDIIVGPGNAYVAEAKRQVAGTVRIDMVAGPSEVVILADEHANPDYIAADLLAQAEHDPLASSILITDSARLAAKTEKAVTVQGRTLNRRNIFEQSLKSYGAILITDHLDEGIDLVNSLAPEHLGLHVEKPWDMLGSIRNAGAVFMGAWSPETVGDYWAGPNHILPTNRTARFSSPLGTEDFLKRSSLIQYSRTALEKNGENIIRFSNMEGLDAHANAVRQRLR